MRIDLHPVTPEARHLKRALEALDRGGVLVYPTDSGYSLGCDARSRPAVNRLYHLKRAMKKYYMALMVRDFSAASDFAKIDNYAFRAMKKSVPGPYTFILPATAHARKLLDVKRPEVGLRMPAHPFADALFALRPEAVLLTTAARVREDESFTEPEEIDRVFGHEVDLVLGMGPVPIRPTTIVSLVDGEPVVVREGAGAFP